MKRISIQVGALITLALMLAACTPHKPLYPGEDWRDPPRPDDTVGPHGYGPDGGEAIITVEYWTYWVPNPLAPNKHLNVKIICTNLTDEPIGFVALHETYVAGFTTVGTERIPRGPIMPRGQLTFIHSAETFGPANTERILVRPVGLTIGEDKRSVAVYPVAWAGVEAEPDYNGLYARRRAAIEGFRNQSEETLNRLEELTNQLGEMQNR